MTNPGRQNQVQLVLGKEVEGAVGVAAVMPQRQRLQAFEQVQPVPHEAQFNRGDERYYGYSGRTLQRTHLCSVRRRRDRSCKEYLSHATRVRCGMRGGQGTRACHERHSSRSLYGYWEGKISNSNLCDGHSTAAACRTTRSPTDNAHDVPAPPEHVASAVQTVQGRMSARRKGAEDTL